MREVISSFALLETVLSSAVCYYCTVLLAVCMYCAFSHFYMTYIWHLFAMASMRLLSVTCRAIHPYPELLETGLNEFLRGGIQSSRIVHPLSSTTGRARAGARAGGGAGARAGAGAGAVPRKLVAMCSPDGESSGE